MYTAGRRWKPEHVVWAESRIRDAGAELHLIDRGGSVTFHGPGQLVGYPILDLGVRPDARRYVHDLEEVVIRACGDAGVTALGRNPSTPASGRATGRSARSAFGSCGCA